MKCFIVKGVFYILIIFVLNIFSIQSFAGESYRHQVNGSYYTGEKSGNSATNKLIVFYADYSFYFKSVGTGKGPCEEAAFLNKSSLANLGFGYSEQKADIGGYILEDDTLYFGGGIRYVLPAPVFIKAGFFRINSRSRILGMEDESSLNIISLGAGYYVLDNLAIDALYNLSKAEKAAGDDTDLIEFGIKYVHLIDEQKAVNLEGGFSSDNFAAGNDNTLKTYSFTGDFYAFRELGIGCGITAYDYKLDVFDYKTYMARVKWYAVPNIGIGFKYECEDYNDKETGGDFFELSVTGRI